MHPKKKKKKKLAAFTHKIFVAVTLRKPFEKLGISPPFKKEVMTVSYRFEELLEKIIMKYEEKVEEQRQGSEIMDALLEAYRDQKAEYKITKNHIEVLLAVNVYPLVACNNTSLG